MPNGLTDAEEALIEDYRAAGEPDLDDEHLVAAQQLAEATDFRLEDLFAASADLVDVIANAYLEEPEADAPTANVAGGAEEIDLEAHGVGTGEIGGSGGAGRSSATETSSTPRAPANSRSASVLRSATVRLPPRRTTTSPTRRRGPGCSLRGSRRTASSIVRSSRGRRSRCSTSWRWISSRSTTSQRTPR
jgi:hypothetical protein